MLQICLFPFQPLQTALCICTSFFYVFFLYPMYFRWLHATGFCFFSSLNRYTLWLWEKRSHSFAQSLVRSFVRSLLFASLMRELSWPVSNERRRRKKIIVSETGEVQNRTGDRQTDSLHLFQATSDSVCKCPQCDINTFVHSLFKEKDINNTFGWFLITQPSF